MSSTTSTRHTTDPEGSHTVVREREALYRRLAKIEKHLDVAQWDHGAGESAQPGLRAMLDLLPYPALVRFNGRVDHANDAAVAVLAAGAREDLEGLPWRDLLHPDDRPFPGARPAPEPADAESPMRRFVRRDGVVVQVAVRELQIPWRGRSAGLILVGEGQVAPGEGAADGLFGPIAVRAIEGAGEGIWEWELSTGEMIVSARLKALLGYEGTGTDDHRADWQTLIHPEDRARSERRLREHLEGSEPSYDCDLRLRCADGRYIWLHVRGRAQRDARGRVQRIAGLACDVTERKAHERERARAEARAVDTQAQLADAMNLAGDGFGLFDAEDRLVLFNQRYRDLFPQIAAFVVKGAFYEDIARAALEAGVVKVAEDRRTAWLESRMTRHRNPTGSFLERASDGRFIRITECRLSSGGTVMVCGDITPLKRAEQDLKARVAELEAVKAMLESQSAQLQGFARQLAEAKELADLANRTKSEFLANMSHELRTPLNAIMGFSEVIKNQLFGPVGLPQYVDYAGDIYNSGAHLLEIINDILDLSKVEAGKLEIAEEPINLREIAEAVNRLVRGRAEASGIKLVHAVPAELPFLFADKRKLKQMLLNLLSNAIKFTPEGGTVDLIGHERSDGGVSLCVRDTGIGIPADQFDLVLSPFGQVDSALAREHQGTGLGLPLVKALIELHGGRIELLSEVGRGTEVFLHFPAQRSRRY